MSLLSLRSPLMLALLATLCLVLTGATVAIVPETSQALVLRLGRIVDVYNPYQARQAFGQTGAGLKLRVPVIDRVLWIDKRIRSLALTDQRLLSADRQPVQVDALVQYRIVDPELFYHATGGSDEALVAALKPAFGTALRTDLGKRTFDSVLGADQGDAMAGLRADLASGARQYGADIVDVRMTRIGLPDGAPLQGALQRMNAARLEEAEAIRAEGTRRALEIKAQADADAATLYQRSFGRDLAFYDFYRAMQSYRTVFAGKPGSETNMVLSPDNDYLRQFKGR